MVVEFLVVNHFPKDIHFTRLSVGEAPENNPRAMLRLEAGGFWTAFFHEIPPHLSLKVVSCCSKALAPDI